jgi:hypothetical protein
VPIQIFIFIKFEDNEQDNKLNELIFIGQKYKKIQ